MIIISIYFANRTPIPPTPEDMERWLYVTNCGYYRNITKDYRIIRENGRSDYQLIYVKSGQIIASDELLTEGCFRIYVPDERQSYTYLAGEGTSYLWVHFIGKKVPDIFRSLGLGSGRFHFNDRADELEKIWYLLCEAVCFRQGNPDNYSASLLLAAFHLLVTPRAVRLPLSGAAALLEDVSTEVTVPMLAKKYHMSVGHFIASFKAAYGHTPMNYRAMKQFEQAKTILWETDMAVSAVSELCGFSDPLYFSRQFKKHTGVSPTQFRSQYRQTQDN